MHPGTGRLFYRHFCVRGDTTWEREGIDLHLKMTERVRKDVQGAANEKASGDGAFLPRASFFVL